MTSKLFRISPYASLVAFLCVFLAKTSIAQTIEGCVITDMSCPCTVRPSSGACMRYQGDGYCLMGSCNDGYKCDCLAYERCSISICAKHIALEGVIPSLKSPFRCKPSPDAGQCKTFASFIDTIDATDHALLEASQSMMTAKEDETRALQDILTMQEERNKIDDALKRLDSFAGDVTEDERADVEETASLVTNLIISAQNEAALQQKASVEVTNAVTKAIYHRRVAHDKEKEAAERDAEEKIEATKPDNQVNCNPCDRLRREADRLRNERREAAVMTGTWAKRAREGSNNGSMHRKNIENMKQKAASGSSRAIEQVEKILTRLQPSGSGTERNGGASGSDGAGESEGADGASGTGGSGGVGRSGGTGADGNNDNTGNNGNNGVRWGAEKM